MSSTLTTRILSGPAASIFLARRWPDLYSVDPFATPYQASGWLAGWARHLPAHATPLVALVTTGAGEPVAALALAHHREVGGRTRVGVLSAPHAEYVRPIGPGSEDPAVVSALGDCLQELDDAGIVLTGVPMAGTLGRHLAGRPGWRHTTVPCAAVALPLDLADPSLSASTRRAHRRRQRDWTALAAAGRVTYTRSRTDAQLRRGFLELAALHRLRWAPADESEHVLREEQWLAVLEDCGPGIATIASLRLDGTTIAAQLLLVRNGICYSVLPAWDPARRDLAPGHALLRYIAEDLAHGGWHGVPCRTLDLGRTVDSQVSYKAQYSAFWSETATFTRPPAADCVPSGGRVTGDTGLTGPSAPGRRRNQCLPPEHIRSFSGA